LNDCPFCAKKLEMKHQTYEFVYKAVQCQISYESLYCENCEEGFLSQNDIKNYENKVSQKKEEIDNKNL
jgi:hypothetical protein